MRRAYTSITKATYSLGTGIDLIALDPFVEGLRHAAKFGGDGFDGGSHRGVLVSLLLHHAIGAFEDLGRKAV